MVVVCFHLEVLLLGGVTCDPTDSSTGRVIIHSRDTRRGGVYTSCNAKNAARQNAAGGANLSMGAPINCTACYEYTRSKYHIRNGIPGRNAFTPLYITYSGGLWSVKFTFFYLFFTTPKLYPDISSTPALSRIRGHRLLLGSSPAYLGRCMPHHEQYSTMGIGEVQDSRCGGKGSDGLGNGKLVLRVFWWYSYNVSDVFSIFATLFLKKLKQTTVD